MTLSPLQNDQFVCGKAEFDSPLMRGDHRPEVSLILASINPAVAVECFLPSARGQAVRFGRDPISARKSFSIETDDGGTDRRVDSLFKPLSSLIADVGSW